MLAEREWLAGAFGGRLASQRGGRTFYVKAIIQERYGTADDLGLHEVPDPTPGPGQVLVEMRASSVHADVWHVVTGRPSILRLMGGGFIRPKNRIPGTDVAGVVVALGESMNRRIPNGAWCLWRANPTGTRQGKVVLAQHGDINDPELGGRYTVKVYESEKVATDDGGWRHSVVRLKPDSDDASFEPIVFENLEEGELAIVAELVEVLA